MIDNCHDFNSIINYCNKKWIKFKWIITWINKYVKQRQTELWVFCSFFKTTVLQSNYEGGSESNTFSYLFLWNAQNYNRYRKQNNTTGLKPVVSNQNIIFPQIQNQWLCTFASNEHYPNLTKVVFHIYHWTTLITTWLCSFSLFGLCKHSVNFGECQCVEFFLHKKIQCQAFASDVLFISETFY